MATTPTWITLLVGFLGGGLGSTILTQYFSSRRDAAARSYEHRKEAYVNYITKFYGDWRAHTEQESLGWPHGDPPEDCLVPLYDRLILIRIFGTAKAARLAEKLFHHLSTGIEADKIEDMIDDLMHQIRRDLSIPGHWRRVKTEPPSQLPSIPPPPPVPPPSRGSE